MYITCRSYSLVIQTVRISEENFRFYELVFGGIGIIVRTDTEHFKQLQPECISPFDILNVIHSSGFHTNIVSGAQLYR